MRVFLRMAIIKILFFQGCSQMRLRGCYTKEVAVPKPVTLTLIPFLILLIFVFIVYCIKSYLEEKTPVPAKTESKTKPNIPTTSGLAACQEKLFKKTFSFPPPPRVDDLYERESQLLFSANFPRLEIFDETIFRSFLNVKKKMLIFGSGWD